MSDEKKNILLVEDEFIIAHAESQTLQNNGYSVIISPSASQAIETIKSGRDIDLILMDIDLGKGMDGTDAAEIILRERDIPILFLSSHTEPEIVEKTEKITSYGYIVKNTGNTVLFASIKMAFRLHEARVQTKLHEQMLRTALSERMRAEEELKQTNEELASINRELQTTNKDLFTANEKLTRLYNTLRESEQSIRKSEAALAMAQEHANLGSWELDLETKTGSWSAEMYRLMDRNPNPGPPSLDEFMELVHPEDRHVIDGAVLRPHEPYNGHTSFDYRSNPARGPIRHYRATYHVVRNDEGRIIKHIGTALDITELKQTELALMNSEATLRNIINNLPMGIHQFHLAPDGRLIFEGSNPAGDRILGIDHSRFIGRTIENMFPNLIQTEVPEQYRQVCAGGTPWHTEQIEYKDDKIKDAFEIHVFPTEPGRMVALFGDITERKRIEAAVRERELLLSRITDNMIDIIILADYYGKIQYASPSFKTILGYESEDLSGRPVFDFVHQDDMKKILDAYREDLNLLKPRNIEFRYRHKDGHYLWVESLANPLFSEEGRPIGAVISIRDITERKRTEEALHESEERFRSLFEESPAAIVIINTDGIVTDINPMHQHLTGYPAEELIGLHFTDFPDNIKEDIPDYHKTFSEMLQGKKFHNQEVNLRHRNGMIINTEFDIAPIQSGKKAGSFQIIIKDVTDRKLAEIALSKTLTEKEILLRELHHRVKNSFAIVTGIVGLEASRLNDPAMRDVLRDIRNRIGSLSNLYAILNHEHEVKNIRLDDYLNQMSHSLIDSYISEKSRITPRMELDEIHIDVNRAISIGLMVNELFTNALKYAFPGSREGTIGVLLKQEGGNIRIEVSDDGVGLPPDFSINKPKGLGLELVRLLLNQLDGTMRIDSGAETVFRISIPSGN